MTLSEVFSSNNNLDKFHFTTDIFPLTITIRDLMKIFQCLLRPAMIVAKIDLKSIHISR